MGCTPSTLSAVSLHHSSNQCRCQCHKNGAKPLTLPSDPSSKTSCRSAFPENFVDDPRLPLSGRQIFLLKRSWKGISRNMCETGINMFLSLFEKNERLLSFFNGLQSFKTLTELRTSKLLESHVRGVMLTVDEAINGLDDVDSTIAMLLSVGRSHVRFQHFDPQNFLLLKEPFLLAVRDTLDDRFTAHMEVIYQQAIVFILNTLIAGFSQHVSTSAASVAAGPDGHRSEDNSSESKLFD